MKPKMPLTVKFSIAALFLFSVVGLLILIVIVHENIHRFDMRNVDKDDEFICYLTFDYGALGYYYMTYNTSMEEEVREAFRYSEIRAYTSTAVLIIIYNLAFYSFLNYFLSIRKNKNDKKN